jgi:hypothetical protein
MLAFRDSFNSEVPGMMTRVDRRPAGWRGDWRELEPQATGM